MSGSDDEHSMWLEMLRQTAHSTLRAGTPPAMSLATQKGKQFALDALAERRAHPPERIDNASLYAGSPMYFYCKACGWLADTLPESYTTRPRRLCTECQALQDCGWLE